MSHGAKDYSNIANVGNLYRLDDLAELAVRLGSPIAYDRRGQLQWVYSFDDGLTPVLPVLSGANSKLTLSTGMYVHGIFSCTMWPGNVAGNYAGFAYSVPPSNDKIMSAFAHFRVVGAAAHYYHHLIHYTSTGYYYAHMYFDFANDTVFVSTLEDGYYDLQYSIADIASASYLAFVKIVCDLNTHKIVRAQINGDGFDLHTKSMTPHAFTVRGGVQLWEQVATSDGSSVYAVVDTVGIMTNDE